MAYYNDEKFNKDSKEFCVHWDMGREAARKANIKLNEMVSGLHKQHENWSYTKIAKTLWLKHQHLEGFTTKIIRKKLDENNLKLIDSSKQHPPTPKVEQEENEEENNVIEHCGPTDGDQKVIEHSSISPTNLEEEIQITEDEADEILKEEGVPIAETTATEEEPEVIYDPQLITNYIKKIAKLEEEIAKLKIERIPTRANKSDFKYNVEFTDEMFLLIRENSGICPLIGTHFCDKDDGYMRFDKAQILLDIKKAQKAKAK